MARPLPKIGQEKAAELESAWDRHTEAWQRQRLTVLRLVAQHRLIAAEIAQACGLSSRTIYRYIKLFLAKGVSGLLTREHGGGRTTAMAPEQLQAFREALKKGAFRRAKDAQEWIKRQAGQKLSVAAVYRLLGKSRRSLESAAQAPRQKRRGPGGSLQAKPGGKTPSAQRSQARKNPRLGAR